MPNKLTDNEIVKALENAEYRRDGITLRGFYLDHEIIKQVIDLINRQKAEIKEWKRVVETWVEQHEKDKAEIERLKKSNRNWRRKVQRLKADINIELDNFASEYDYNIKAEAYKEFAERLKATAKANEWNGTICGVDIDNLLKELVGDEK
jgi:hypothetical protein